MNHVYLLGSEIKLGKQYLYKYIQMKLTMSFKFCEKYFLWKAEQEKGT